MLRACSEKTEYINDMVTGNLDAKTKAVIDEHLLACAACRRYLEELSAMKNSLASLTLSAPEDIKGKVMQEIIKENLRNVSAGKRWLKPAYVASYAVAASLVLILSMFLLNGGLLDKGTMESSELKDDEYKFAGSQAERDADSTAGILNVHNNSEGDAAYPVPESDIDMLQLEDRGAGFTASVLEEAGYSFYTSAFLGNNTKSVNPDGTAATEDFAYTDDQDILYITANYDMDEIMNILMAHYSLAVEEMDKKSLLVRAPDEMIASLERSLDLVAVNTVDEARRSYLIRIVYFKTE